MKTLWQEWQLEDSIHLYYMVLGELLRNITFITWFLASYRELELSLNVILKIISGQEKSKKGGRKLIYKQENVTKGNKSVIS